MEANKRHRPSLAMLRVLELMALAIALWSLAEFRRFTPGGATGFDFPGSAIALAMLSCAVFGSGVLVRSLVGLESRGAKIEFSLLLLGFVWFPLVCGILCFGPRLIWVLH